MAEEQQPAQAQTPIAGAAQRMKKEGMSTKDIMLVLSQSRHPNLTVLDSKVAQVKIELQHLATTREKETKKITQSIQAEVEFIGSTKSTQQFHANFNQQLTPILEQQTKLIDERKKLNEECKQVIKQFKAIKAQDATVDKQTLLSQARPIFTAIEALNKSTQRLVDQNISLAHAADHLHRDTARVAATAGGFKPTPQTPAADYMPDSPD